MAKDKSGYGKLLDMFIYIAKAVQSESLSLCKMKTATSIECRGIILEEDDYSVIDDKDKNVAAGDTVLIAIIPGKDNNENEYILVGKVV